MTTAAVAAANNALTFVSETGAKVLNKVDDI
jgi:hypothetical protein